MNKLLFTLSLVVLVAVPAMSYGNFNELIRSQKKCLSTSTYSTFKNTFDEFKRCINHLANVTQISEIFSKDNKKIDEKIMQKTTDQYCGIQNELLVCVDNLAQVLNPCFLDVPEVEQKDFLQTVANKSLDYVCKLNGSEWQKFTYEDGLNCMELQSYDIESCVNGTYNKYVENDTQLIVDPLTHDQHCHNLIDLKNCVKSELKQCTETAPMYLFGNLSLILLDELKCQREANSATIQSSLMILLFSSILFVQVLSKIFNN